ncbi:MAG TPA: CRTAC1 family protein [Blastocatellia bacterium]|nr:CRTAC1 family protein [Blastocatellia bacterium]
MNGVIRAVLAILALAAVAPAQAPDTQAPKQGGASTGGVYAARRDAQNRPITAGGFVDGAPVLFDDATAAAGLGGFVLRSGGEKKRYILETTSAGVALFDYDNDGWLDIYLVNGSSLDALAGKAATPSAALFRNKHDGTFEDVTRKAGVANERWGMGVATGDFDNDGWTDLFVTNFGASRLYRNKGDGTFEDVAQKAGVTFDGWATGATFGDYDRDGRLDLFVAGYVAWDLKNPPEPGKTGVGFNFCTYRGVEVMCGPRGLKGLGDKLYRNKGDGTFEDVSAKAGVADTAGFYGFSSVFFDADGDGDLDLVVANDSTANYLYLNRGDGTFEDASLPSGFALSENGREQACMGIAVGDYDNDGRDDLYVTNFSDDSNTLYHNDGDGNFMDVTSQSGHGEPTIPFLGWGTGFLDYDNDGLKDLFVANGHVYPEVDKYDWGMTWQQKPLLFRNTNGRRFELAPAATGSGLAVVRSYRGAAFGDIDNDGDIDVVMSAIDAPPVLLKNRGVSGAHWLTVKLAGAKTGPRDATGAVVTCVTGTVAQRGLVLSGGSFDSQNDTRVHFGLGKLGKVDRLEVRWPDGSKEQFAVPGIDRIVTLTQGGGKK